MIRQTLGSSPKVFYSSRLKVLILFSLFIEDVLNCVFFRIEGLFVFFLAAITAVIPVRLLLPLCSEMKAVPYQLIYHKAHRRALTWHKAEEKCNGFPPG